MKEIYAKVRMRDNIVEGCKIARNFTNTPLKDIKNESDKRRKTIIC